MIRTNKDIILGLRVAPGHLLVDPHRDSARVVARHADVASNKIAARLQSA